MSIAAHVSLAGGFIRQKVEIQGLSVSRWIGLPQNIAPCFLLLCHHQTAEGHSDSIFEHLRISLFQGQLLKNECMKM